VTLFLAHELFRMQNSSAAILSPGSLEERAGECIAPWRPAIFKQRDARRTGEPDESVDAVISTPYARNAGQRRH